MNRTQMNRWAQVWDATQRPGSIFEFLDWVAEQGFRIIPGEPTEGVNPDPEQAHVDLMDAKLKAAHGSLLDAVSARLNAEGAPVAAESLPLVYQALLAEADAEEYTQAVYNCSRCGRKYRTSERDQLVDAGAGKLKCDPHGPLYDACMRLYNA